jgi:hypothetical protein
VQQPDLGAEGTGERLGLAPDREAPLSQVDDQQDATLNRHDESPAHQALARTA